MNEHIIDKCYLTISHGGIQTEEIIYTREYSKRPSKNPEGHYPYRVRVLLAKQITKKTGHLVNRTSGGRMNPFLFNELTFKLATIRIL